MFCSVLILHIFQNISRLTVEDLPLTVVIDPKGNDLYKSGPAAYLASIEKGVTQNAD